MIHLPRPPRSDRKPQNGFGLIDNLIGAAIFSLFAMGFVGATVSSNALRDENHERAQALQVARRFVEELQSDPFNQLYALYNADGTDDPGGPYSAPGADLTLQSAEESLDGVAGSVNCQVSFPIASSAMGGVELREDLDIPELGLPADLNRDGIIDSLDHSTDYDLLPIAVEVIWTSRGETRRVRLHTVLSDEG